MTGDELDRYKTALEQVIKHWAKAEMQLGTAKQTLVALLRMQQGVSAQAKELIRGVLKTIEKQDKSK